VVVLWLFFGSVEILARDLSWETATGAGVQAFEQGHYTVAAQHFETALAFAQTLPPEDPRVLTSLTNLAAVYHIQDQYAQAASFYERALMLQEQLFGPDDPQLVMLLQTYASLQRQWYPWRSLLPWSRASQLTARADRLQRQAERANSPEGLEWWGSFSEIDIFSPSE
jgi:tetratricopeptide (TPR) repeat protein